MPSNPLATYFPKRHKILHRALATKYTPSEYKRRVRQLIAWTIACPDKILPNSCVEWSERQFRIWAGQEEERHTPVEEDLGTIEESLLACPKCQQHQVDHFTKQTRSADEPETIFAHCLACNYRWRQ